MLARSLLRIFSRSIRDYNLGTNHVLPTGGTARYASVLSVADFVKQSSLIVMDKRDFPTVEWTQCDLLNLRGFYACQCNSCKIVV